MRDKTDSLKAISPKEFIPRIVAFVCNWCSGVKGGSPGSPEGAANVRIVNVMCSGRVTPGLVLKAFELGADGVMVCGCEKGACHYSFGNERQVEMFETSRKLAGLIGLEHERLRVDWLSPDGGEGLCKAMTEFVEQVTLVGPSPLRKSGGIG
ncbi:MAG: hydrogenase iron-sulfur subunit [Candidatus Eisenbacteria bacterium]|nr:hydrogenase iron-sulfur subunit [Candidatus Eisenbacteria bacterium]